LIDEIDAKRRPSLARFIFGLGIRHVGAQTAVDIATEFKSITACQSADLEAFQAIDGVGVVVAESLVAWFADDDNIGLIDKFKEVGVRPFYEKASGTLTGLQFVVTGTLASMGRDEAAEQIRQRGGIFQSSVGKDTTYLVAGGKVGASKLKKAQQYGVEVIDEAAFLGLLHQT
jgi:DNA ligase (NAD+)